MVKNLRAESTLTRRLKGDPAAEEVLAIRAWAEELMALCDYWLDGRERLREAQAEVAQAREYRAETELSRGGRHAS